MSTNAFAAALCAACTALTPSNNSFGGDCDPESMFSAPVAYETGQLSRAVAVGDLNGDGAPDLAAGNIASDNVSILLNQGNGTFSEDVLYPVGVGAWGIAIGDLNGDGHPDIGTANLLGDSVSVLLNQGDGTFLPAVDYAVESGPLTLALGDLDSDGDLDLGVANAFHNTVSVLFNVGDGTFLPQVMYEAGKDPRAIAIEDLNGDSALDIAVTKSGSNKISIFLNEGDGTFAVPPLTYLTGENPSSLAIGDVNGDGSPDLAVANNVLGPSSSVSIFLNQSDGTFAEQVSYDVGLLPRSVVLSDFDSDGDLDLAATPDDLVSLRFNKGDGTFDSPIISFSAGEHVWGAAHGDFDGNGAPDLVVTNAVIPTTELSSVSVLLNQCVSLPADLDDDGSVGFTDLLILLASWGDCPDPPAECPADLDGSGGVGFGDLLILLASWSG